MLPCSFSEVLAVLRADPVLGEEEGDNEAAQDELYDIGHGSDGERHSTRDPLEEDPGEHGEHVACLAVGVGVDATPAPTPRSTSPVHTCSSPSKDGLSVSLPCSSRCGGARRDASGARRLPRCLLLISHGVE